MNKNDEQVKDDMANMNMEVGYYNYDGDNNYSGTRFLQVGHFFTSSMPLS